MRDEIDNLNELVISIEYVCLFIVLRSNKILLIKSLSNLLCNVLPVLPKDFTPSGWVLKQDIMLGSFPTVVGSNPAPLREVF
jgi:hypothetical protein